jgi:hypothetical protein
LIAALIYPMVAICTNHKSTQKISRLPQLETGCFLSGQGLEASNENIS